MQNHTDSNLSIENGFRLSRVKSLEEGFDLNPTTSKIVDINYSKVMSNQSDVDAFHSSGPIQPSNTKLFSVVVSHKNDQTKHNIN